MNDVLGFSDEVNALASVFAQAHQCEYRLGLNFIRYDIIC